MQIIFENEISISICDTENNNKTKAFMKVLVNDFGEVLGENLSFIEEVEDFAGKGFLSNLTNNIE